jgi:uncharacterized membrane protein
MRALTTVLAVCGVLLAGLLGPSRAQQPQNETFELAVCNLSDFQGVFMAVRHKQDAQHWQVDGWYAIPDGGCTLVGTYPRDTFYFYAESNDDGSWAASDSDQTAQAECVNHNQWFQIASGSACAAGQASVRFRLVQVPADQRRFTWTLTGKKSN